MANVNQFSAAISAGKQGDFNLALRLLAQEPVSAYRLYLEGLCYLQLGNFHSAEKSFHLSVELDVGLTEAWVNLSNLQIQNGNWTSALKSASEALDIDPNSISAQIAKAFALSKLGKYGEALEVINGATNSEGRGFAEALNTKGLILKGLNQFDEAEQSLRQSLDLNPELFGARCNLIQVLLLKGERSLAKGEMLKCKEYVLTSRFDDVFSMGLISKELGLNEEALYWYDLAFRLRPHDYRLLIGLLSLFIDRLDWENSSITVEQLFQYHPDSVEDFCEDALIVSLTICNWSRVNQLKPRVLAKVQRGESHLNPLHSVIAFDDPELHYLCAKRAVSSVLGVKHRFVFSRPDFSGSRDRVTLCYVSGDFRDHAVGFLCGDLFKLHDRSKFKVVGLYTGRPSNSPRYHYLKSTFDEFIDAHELPLLDLIEIVRKVSPDILIDLSGHTTYSRLDLFASRVAPVQLTYLGYPGTTGLSQMDFVIADDFVVTPEAADFFSEKVLYVDGCYQVNDDQRERSPTLGRPELGLPSTGFVYACFNGPQKLTPERFKVWGKILDLVPDSCLWLFTNNDLVRSNLRAEFASLGLSPSRLVFAEPASNQYHLSRIGAADLFLDTHPYGAHTTASDALWSNLPVLTLPGKSFQTRVCGSLLKALGLEELIARDEESYIDIAVKCATDELFYKGILHKLEGKKAREAVFSTELKCRQLEKVYLEALGGISY